MNEVLAKSQLPISQKEKDLLEREQLIRAGFRPQVHVQEQFALRVASKRTMKMELPIRESALFGAGAALSLALAIMLFMTARGEVAIAPVVSALWHSAFAYLAERKRKARITLNGELFPNASKRDGQRVLRLALQKNERVIFEGNADGGERKILRRVSAGVQMFWGILLAGVPAAVFIGFPPPWSIIAMILGTFVGTGIFGRGVRTAIASKYVERVVLTNQRVAVIADEGVAHSINLEHLEHRPVVVGRENNRATLAIATQTPPSLRPLPIYGLYGFHDLNEQKAKAVAGEVMDARKKRLELREK